MAAFQDRSFVDVQLKLRRAGEHLQYLKAEIDTFINDGSVSWSPNVDTQTGDVVFRAHIHKPIDPKWSLVMGEFLHNLHSALDAITWQLALPNAVNPEAIQFPIFKDSTEIPGARSKGGVRGYDVSGRKLIREVDPTAEPVIEPLQPYHRVPDPERHPLWILSRLHNIDKHRRLHLMVSQMGVGIYRVTSGDPDAIEEITPMILGDLEDGTEIYRVHPREGVDVSFEPDFAFKVALGGTMLPVDGYPVIPLLMELYDFARVDVAQRFKGFFP